MAENQGRPGMQPGVEMPERSVYPTPQTKQRSPTSALQDAGDELAQKASELAAETKDAALHRADRARRGIGDSLATLGGALRAAGDHLAEKEQTSASRLVQDTASGLEKFATSLREKSLEDVIGEIRTFGRDNAGALIAGTTLAGLALGRLVRTAGQAGSSSTGAGEGAPEDRQFVTPGQEGEHNE